MVEKLSENAGVNLHQMNGNFTGQCLIIGHFYFCFSLLDLILINTRVDSANKIISFIRMFEVIKTMHSWV